ncbi:hypothetical protein C9374_011738 [Naegleria lovaniensis]|uniref:Methyltransferase type 11 domain-containing protein n=1 Tax=Naegleria lovaniensis TaxID=51637 RepID=A0AA88GES0_NAELO|nr:uncharacterized protein C9374_011738 [Naegleria lovaniensis]KAG2373853.1 hypothetical protein C9374_011738 [Naegleria lovaniensis]
MTSIASSLNHSTHSLKHNKASPSYGDKEYWDDRYQKMSEPFDWFQTYDRLKFYLSKHIKNKDSSGLNVGCGTSPLPFEMHHDGYKRVTSIDYSEAAIEAMRRQNTSPDLEFLTMDAKRTNFPSWYFDYAIDKGCFEFNLLSSSLDNGKSYLEEIYRVLKPDGIYFMVSHTPPSLRLPLLQVEDFQWDVKVEKISKENFTAIPNTEESSYHYIYVCKKKELK